MVHTPIMHICSVHNVFLRAAVLLEKPTVVICPNIGVLTSVVLALIPLMRPFAWQHLMMPVLPATEDTLDILDVRPSCFLHVLM